MDVLRKVPTIGFSGDDGCFTEESQPNVFWVMMGVLRKVTILGFSGDDRCFAEESQP